MNRQDTKTRSKDLSATLSPASLRFYVRAVVGALTRRWQSRQRAAQALKLAPAIVAQVPALTGQWPVSRVVPTLNDVTVMMLGPTQSVSQVVVKLAHSDVSLANLERQARVLASIHADVRLVALHPLTATPLAHGDLNGTHYFVETALYGTAAVSLLESAAVRSGFLTRAAETISMLHVPTARPVLTDDALIGRIIDTPLAELRRLRSLKPLYGDVLNRLSGDLRSELNTRTLALSWTHGDYVPENILLHPDGAVSGVVDWEHASEAGLPLLDLALLFLMTRRHVAGQQFAQVVQDVLAANRWNDEEQRLIDTANAQLPGDALDMRPLVLLCWLHHVAGNLSKSVRYAEHPLWLARNVVALLDILRQ